MTEPVAYMLSDFVGNDFTSLELPKNPNNPRGLYFKEQLHPRVKMTQAEFDEFSNLYGKEYGGNGNVFFGLDKAINLENFYPNLNERLIAEKVFDDNFSQAEFVNLWIKFNPSRPEETIEIVPDKKWFVERNDTSDDHRFLSKNVINLDNELNYAALKKSAKQFDTKEQAELWTNPLTEAVQLPVEGE